jgi:hypothetical protein
LGQLLDAGNSVSELPLPVIPDAVWYISKESVSGRGYFTWRFFLQNFRYAAFTWRFLLQIIRDAAFTWRFLFRVVVATAC